MHTESWTKIKGSLVNPRWEIANCYSVNKWGLIRNDHTGVIIYPKWHGKVWLKNIYGGHCEYRVRNIVYATFKNVSTYGKKVNVKKLYGPGIARPSLANLYM